MQPLAKERGKVGEDPVSRFLQKNTGSLQALPPTSDYKGKLTWEIGMDEAAFLKPDGEHDGIYTTGAMDCAVVVAVLRNAFTREVIRVGMMHVDPSLAGKVKPKNHVREFFEKLKEGNSGSVEVIIISGNLEAGKRVFEESDRAGKIIFMNCDVDSGGDRPDSVLVGRNRKVYYMNERSARYAPVEVSNRRLPNFGNDYSKLNYLDVS